MPAHQPSGRRLPGGWQFADAALARALSSALLEPKTLGVAALTIRTGYAHSLGSIGLGAAAVERRRCLQAVA